MNIQVEIDKRDLENIAKMPRQFREASEAVIAKVLDEVVTDVKRAAPVHSGKTRDSFYGELRREHDGIGAFVVSDWFVARLQNYGFSEHIHIMLSGAKAIIPGKPKRAFPHGHFVEPAIERGLERIERMLSEAVERL